LNKITKILLVPYDKLATKEFGQKMNYKYYIIAYAAANFWIYLISAHKLQETLDKESSYVIE